MSGEAAESTNLESELEAMQKRVEEMEQEAQKLRQMQEQVEKELNPKNDADARSVYVGNVDYSVTPEEIQAHFQSCGTINRVTILCDKFSGHPKGYAYVEFADAELVKNALLLNESTLKGRQIKVTEKRTNVPRFARGRGRGRGRRGRRPYYAPY